MNRCQPNLESGEVRHNQLSPCPTAESSYEAPAQVITSYVKKSPVSESSEESKSFEESESSRDTGGYKLPLAPKAESRFEAPDTVINPYGGKSAPSDSFENLRDYQFPPRPAHKSLGAALNEIFPLFDRSETPNISCGSNQKPGYIECYQVPSPLAVESSCASPETPFMRRSAPNEWFEENHRLSV